MPFTKWNKLPNVRIGYRGLRINVTLAATTGKFAQYDAFAWRAWPLMVILGRVSEKSGIHGRRGTPAAASAGDWISR